MNESTVSNKRAATSIVFFADRHYGSYVGRVQADILDGFADVIYIEEDYAALAEALHRNPGSILAVNAIAATPGHPELTPEAEAAVKSHLEKGNDLWVLHGGSAAFWPWKWWRDAMKVRWVRDNDPDGTEPSWHPVEPYSVDVTPIGAARVPGLESWNVPKDELYVGLAQQEGVEVWCSASFEGRDWPQVYCHLSPWNGRVFGWIPGHDPDVMANHLAPMFTGVAKAWLE